MDSERRVAASSSRNGLVVGSVWESRMKGSFKVFNGDDKNMNPSQETEKNHSIDTSGEVGQLDKKLRSKETPIGVGGGGKRKTWKSDTNSEGIERNPGQIPKVRSENKKISGELSDSMDGNGTKNSPIQRSPVQKKGRQEWNKEQSVSIDGIERSPVQKTIKIQSLSRKGSVSCDFSDGIERSPVQRGIKIQSLSRKGSVGSDFSDGIERSPVQNTIKIQSVSRKGSVGSDFSDGVERNDSSPLREVKSESTKGIGISDDCNKGIEGSVEDIEKENADENEIKKDGSDFDQSFEELGVVCEEKLVNDDMGKVNSSHTLDFEDDDEDEQDCNGVRMEEKDEEINEERSIVVVEQIDVSSEPKPISQVKKKKSSLVDVVIEDKKIHQRNQRSIPISKTIKKQPPSVVNHLRIIPKPILADELPSQRAPKTHSKLQSFIDLIMWREVSKSALIFGFGTFTILSSSYTKDLNISFISVISYLGLIYLAAIFIFRSIISRSAIELDNITNDEEYVVGEEEAIWALKLFLPYLNEFLLKVKALFSGDPTTTMKLAVLLFILARCGSSITIWKMAKLGFLGVFTVPKICSSYSSQLTAYGTFWVQRFRDAWESCSHKKAVAFGVFTLVWNLSSIVARIWAVFMLFVAFKYYQQSMVRDEGVAEEEATTQRNQRSGHERRYGKISTSIESTKPKKRS